MWEVQFLRKNRKKNKLSFLSHSVLWVGIILIELLNAI